MEDVLSLFRNGTAEWFRNTLGEPTPVQKEAWGLIASGKHTLVSAPTGTGKTLSAFLVFLDRMKKQALEGTLKPELQLIYVSPLKSLAADIRENLRRPLTGIGADNDITIGIRTGDTSAYERQKMIKNPPHILITTPESLYLMLTSKTGQNMLATAGAVILDELHALIDTKRGAHLMLSIARLDILCRRNLQRIGLSATIAPLKTAAEYLAPEEVGIAAPVMEKKIRLDVLGPYAAFAKGRRKDPVWEEIGKLVYSYCQGKRSVIAFVEGRRYAEKLAYYVNLIGGEDFARVHHGSLSKEQRIETEIALREGRLRLLCATSSMELGIDVGEIDRVLQVGCPRTISGTMQRLGRAGHNPDRTSVMYLFPRTAAECVSCGMTAQLAREGGVEFLNPPVECLDILAQHLVSMAAFRSYDLNEVMKILPRAWSFRNLTKDDVKAVLEMLAGDYEHGMDIPARPRVLYDRIHERVEGDGYSRMLAVSAGGTIPDKGMYSVKTEDGVKIGEADEEFVYESRKGDRFILGSFGWRITNISKDTVTVTQASTESARLPFWKGEIKGRNKRTGEAFGRMLRSFNEAYQDGKLLDTLRGVGLDESAAQLAYGYLERQINTAGSLPDHKTILIEHFKDTSGNGQMMIHSVFGRRINAPLSLLAAHAVRGKYAMEIGSVDEEDGFLIYSYGDRTLPEGILFDINPNNCEKLLEIMLPSTPLFNMAFRYNSARALMMGVKRNGRHPLWLQRLKSAQMLEQLVRENSHPLIRETRRECMHELWDCEGVKELLYDIRSGAVEIREIYTDMPSPMSLPLQWAQEAAVMYDYAPTPLGIHGAVQEELNRQKELSGQEELITPGNQELIQVQKREKIPTDEEKLHSLLMAEGDLAAGELDIPAEWLDNLAKDGRAIYLEQGLWIAAEQQQEYAAAFEEEPPNTDAVAGCEEAHTETMEERLHIVRRMLRYRGAADAEQIAERYGLNISVAQEILKELEGNGEAIEKDGIYYHAKLYSRARAYTLKNRRMEIKTCPVNAYEALMLSRTESGMTKEECLKSTLERYAGVTFPVAYWEELLLPERVRNYRPSMLDSFLAGGELFWHMSKDGGLQFDYQAEIDWEADICKDTDLTLNEEIIYEALIKRGASFIQALNGLLPGESPYDALMSLMEKGLIYADSFVPARQWIDREKIGRSAARQRVNARIKAMSAGRWDVVRQIKPPSIEKRLDRCFERSLILCRETAAQWGLPWQDALSVLRIWEYTGRVRRGYFVEGMSGAQFIREKDYAGTVRMLQKPEQKIIWINAADPLQCFGKTLPHMEGRNFLNVPGTVAAFCGGIPAAVFERQGRVLRVFDEENLKQTLSLFADEYKRGKFFPARKRIVVKDYPETAAEALEDAGFAKEMKDYVLYR